MVFVVVVCHPVLLLVVALVLVLMFAAWSLYAFHVFHMAFLCLLISACVCNCVRRCASHMCVMSAHVQPCPSYGPHVLTVFAVFPFMSLPWFLYVSRLVFHVLAHIPFMPRPCLMYPLCPLMSPHVSPMYVSSCGFRGCPFSMRMRCPYKIGRDSWVRGGQVCVVLKNSPLNGGRNSHRMHMEHKRKRSVPWVG